MALWESPPEYIFENTFNYILLRLGWMCHWDMLQQKALKEFERNQKTMLSLIKKLEEKRKRELEQAKKKKKEPQKIPDKKTPKPAITPEVAFPK